MAGRRVSADITSPEVGDRVALRRAQQCDKRTLLPGQHRDLGAGRHPGGRPAHGLWIESVTVTSPSRYARLNTGTGCACASHSRLYCCPDRVSSESDLADLGNRG